MRKAPKLFVRDTGLLHALLNVRNRSELYSSPRFGASWEGLAIGIVNLPTLEGLSGRSVGTSAGTDTGD